ncbi:MAG: hypothetical protein KAG96_00640 [Ichthyobacteriaceae bacterium]|nr:hypothetical protein [Ichthyobacteriaceae bacterium]
MKKFKSIIATLLFASSLLSAQEKAVFELDFKKTNTGELTNDQLSAEGGKIRWAQLNNNAKIVDDAERGKVLSVEYPKGSVGPQTGGSQFIKSLEPANEYYLDYYMKFDEGFDFVSGGKLPGLTSGGSTYTGGNNPDNGEGWSARYMWVKKGEMVVYFYYMDKVHQYGDPVKMNVFFETGKWYRLTQRIKLNEDNLPNGIMQVWVDGQEVINNTKIRYRLWGKGMIDTFYFSTFHGGASKEWAPNNDSFTRFDKIRVTKTKPNF